MNRESYEARKAGIKRMRAQAGQELDRLRKAGGPIIDRDYQRAVVRYGAIQEVLHEFIRKNTQPRGGARILYGASKIIQTCYHCGNRKGVVQDLPYRCRCGAWNQSEAFKDKLARVGLPANWEPHFGRHDHGC